MSGDDLDDLINFLSDRRLQMRLMALDIIKGLTASPDGIDKLKAKVDKLLVFVLRLVPVPDPQPQAIQLSEGALISLVNLSQDTDCANKMVAAKTIGRVMDYLREGVCPHHRLMTMLLCNLTVSDDGCKELLQLGQEKLEGLNMAILLKKFMMSGVNWVEGQEDPFEHVAGILTNVTRLPQARQLLLQPGRGLLQLLVAQLRCPGEMRKRGSAGAVKNCCVEAEKDKTLDIIVADEVTLSRMLSCLDGQEPKEKDDTVREAMAESLAALASTKAGRDALWKVKAPEVLKKGYEYEEHPGVCRAMEHIAETFMFHAEVAEGDEQGQDVDSQAPDQGQPAEAA